MGNTISPKGIISGGGGGGGLVEGFVDGVSLKDALEALTPFGFIEAAYTA